MTLLPQYKRYIIRTMAGPVLFVAISLTMVLWLSQSLRFIELIVNRGLPLKTFIYLTSLLMPSLVGLTLPIAIFCASIYVYNRLIMDSELVVFENSGLSKTQLATPALMIGAICALIGYSISFYFLPASYREFKDMQFFIRNNFATVLLQEGVFNSPVEGLTVYIKERNDEGVLKGILVHDNRNAQKPLTMMAQEGTLSQTPSGPRFILSNGNRQEIDHKSGMVSFLHFDDYTLDISIYAKDTTREWREPEERFIGDLINPEPGLNDEQKAKLYAELHQRMTWPFYNMVLCLIPVTLLLTGQFNRRGQIKRMLLATAICFAVMASNLAIVNLVGKYNYLAALQYFFPFVCVISSLYVLMREDSFEGNYIPSKVVR